MKRVRKLNDFKQHSIVMAEPGMAFQITGDEMEKAHWPV